MFFRSWMSFLRFMCVRVLCFFMIYYSERKLLVFGTPRLSRHTLSVQGLFFYLRKMLRKWFLFLLRWSPEGSFAVLAGPIGFKIKTNVEIIFFLGQGRLLRFLIVQKSGSWFSCCNWDGRSALVTLKILFFSQMIKWQWHGGHSWKQEREKKALIL